MDAKPFRLTGIAHVILGTLILGTGIWGLWRDLAPLSTAFYIMAWWGIIFLADGFCVLCRGSSLLTTRRGHLIPILVTSVTFWMFFELLNYRFQNWYYIGVIPFRGVGSLAYAAAFTFLAFSTVFMGMFEIYDAVSAAGIMRNWRGRARTFPDWILPAVQFTGIAMASVALARPYYLAPLIWGSFSFLVDPVNYRLGARSLLRDLENGEWGIVGRVLLAGLISGIFWESANFFAPQKWIYTVRGLENFKLFEMPLLGFLGFPGLMIDAMAAYGLFTWAVLGNRSWEHPDDVRHPMVPRRDLPARIFRVSLVPQAAFWVFVGATVAPIGSVELEIRDLPLVTREAAVALEEQGISRPMQLLRQAVDPARRDDLRQLTGCKDEEFGALLDQADLYAFKGIGSWYGPLLNRAGILRVEQLASQDTDELHRTLLALSRTEPFPDPSRDMVNVWILAARSRSILQRPGS